MQRSLVVWLSLTAVSAGLTRARADGPAAAEAATPAWAKVSARQKEEAARAKQPVAFENALGMRFVFVPPGTFSMGSPPEEEGHAPDETLHEVTLSAGFHLAIHETTNAQYRRFKPEHRSGATGDDLPLGGDDQPVVRVSHADAVAFCAWLGTQDAAHAYRLPTEAEWEHACRAGTKTPFSNGATLTTAQANFDGGRAYGGVSSELYRATTVAVGSFPPNAWGLFDMHGNVWEWCQDVMGAYPAGSVTDPKGPAEGTHRVRRGGGWGGEATSLRCAFRRNGHATRTREGDTGLRVAASPTTR